MGVELRELRAFVAVVEEGGMSAGGRRLHISQSALSQTIRSLERSLGVSLLVRSPTGVVPTAQGHALLVGARDLIARHDGLLAKIVDADGSSGRLRVGVPLEFPVQLLSTALVRAETKDPTTRIELVHASSHAQIEALTADAIDVALVRDRPADPALDVVLAVREAMGVILTAAASERLADPDGVHLHRLAGLEWIAFSRAESPAWYDQVAATLRGHGIAVAEPDTRERPVTIEVKLAAAGTGRSFALAAPGWAQPLPDGLVWLPRIGAPIVRHTWAVWRSTARRRDLAALVAIFEED